MLLSCIKTHRCKWTSKRQRKISSNTGLESSPVRAGLEAAPGTGLRCERAAVPCSDWCGRGARGTIAPAAQPRRARTTPSLVKKDPAVETAEEAKEPAEADINELCKDMFSKMATYLTGELTATSEDYKLLENMNKLTSLKYLEMKDIAINISRNLKDLNQKCKYTKYGRGITNGALVWEMKHLKSQKVHIPLGAEGKKTH
ncbi:biogenesis of lysosome-related organelles complex 1 subunit 2 isoform X2 [Manacus candei]|uniref:biogenesis of lysosome-related organelles complex 1 subunit 2 isoform X2 n=1 Tax=Manacus candei TaxID=415023 RepID=UPI00222712D2|nr:biogenesis of lysosome-related organelles complex 1 subunit 2 isoform X2 [Manacus candei]